MLLEVFLGSDVIGLIERAAAYPVLIAQLVGGIAILTYAWALPARQVHGVWVGRRSLSQ